MMIFMASSFRRRAARAQACSVREAAVRDEERGGAGSSVAGWTGRVDSMRADRNYLPSCQRRVARAEKQGPEPGEWLEAQEQVALEVQERDDLAEAEVRPDVAAATPGEDDLGE